MALTLNDALRIAKTDPVFAKQLLTSPESLKSAFGLSDSQVAAIKTADLKSILSGISDPAPGAGPVGGGIY